VEEIVKTLIEQNARLTEQIVELSRLIANQKDQSEPDWAEIRTSAVPMYMSETEEDARHLLNTEQISFSEYENLLKELDFANPTLTLAD